MSEYDLLKTGHYKKSSTARPNTKKEMELAWTHVKKK